MGRAILLRVAVLQHRLLAPNPQIELGLTVIGLWLAGPSYRPRLSFGAGDLRHLLDITPAVPYAAHSFFAIETGIIVCNTIAIGLVARTLLSERYPIVLTLAGFFLLALAIRALAAAILVDPGQAFVY